MIQSEFPVHGIAISASDRVYVHRANDSTQFFQGVEAEAVDVSFMNVKHRGLRNVTFSPDGKRLSFIHESSRAYIVVETSWGDVEANFKISDSKPSLLASGLTLRFLNNQGDLLAGSSVDGIHYWDLSDGTSSWAVKNFGEAIRTLRFWWPWEHYLVNGTLSRWRAFTDGER